MKETLKIPTPNKSNSCMLKISASNIFTYIDGYLPPDFYQKLQRKLSFRPKGYEFSTLYNRFVKDKNGKNVRRMWDGWRRQIWKTRGSQQLYFPTGLFSIVTIFCKEHKLEYSFHDTRIKPDRNLDLKLSKDLVIRPYQNEIVNKSCRIQRGIIQAATGSGKTVISAAMIQKLGVSPFIFFVTSIDLLSQAKSSFEKFLTLNGSPLKVGQIGGGTVDIQDVNVMTVQTAVRAAGKTWNKDHKFDSEDTDDKTPLEQRREDILKLLHEAKGSICDEVQHWRAETCQLVARNLKSAYYTYGCSATPYRDEGDDIMIQACFGKKIAEVSASELIKENWLIKPSIKIVHVRGETSVYRQWQQLYKDQVSDNTTYNEMVSNIANSYIDNGRLVLVLVQQIIHGKKLAEMIPGAVFLSGSSSKKKREEGIQKLRDREISCIVSTVIFDEGIDVRPLDTLLLAGQGKSRVRAMQRIGRILRPFPSKHVATAIDFRIHQKYLLEHSKEREKMYRTEKEYEIEEIDPNE